jgi:hypothetical protein
MMHIEKVEAKKESHDALWVTLLMNTVGTVVLDGVQEIFL